MPSNLAHCFVCSSITPALRLRHGAMCARTFHAHTCTAERNSAQEGVAGREDVAPLFLKYKLFLFFIEHSSAHAQPSSMLSCHSFTPSPQTTQHTDTEYTAYYFLVPFGRLYRIRASSASSSSSWGKIDQLMREAWRAHTRRLFFGCRLGMQGSGWRRGEGKCRRATPCCRALTTSSAMAFDDVSFSSCSS